MRKIFAAYKKTCVWIAAILLVGGLIAYDLYKAPYWYIPEDSFEAFKAHKSLRILIAAPHGCIGEYQTAVRMCDVLKKMGYCPIYINKNFLISLFSLVTDTDISVSFYTKMNHPKESYNYLVYHHMGQMNPKIHDYKIYKHIEPTVSGYNYDGILSVMPTEITRKFCKNHPNVIPFYLSALATEFYDKAPKTELFFSGASWDKYRTNYLEKLYKKLDATDYFNMYGKAQLKKSAPKSYRGFIPFGANTVLKTMQKHGIALVLHSEDHFKNNITTSRIFEAAAASCVIICDRLPFVIENFGGSVLYIDRNASPEEMFKQIDNHMKWILSHQKEAIELARRSHKIFVDKFTLERQMKSVIDNYRGHTKK